MSTQGVWKLMPKFPQMIAISRRCTCSFICSFVSSSAFFFFFQAEDGIRDGTVTGVQTCALPISAHCHAPPALPPDTNRHWAALGVQPANPVRIAGRRSQNATLPASLDRAHVQDRSEERRVGKESRSE